MGVVWSEKNIFCCHLCKTFSVFGYNENSSSNRSPILFEHFFMFVFGGNLLTYFLARGNEIAMNIEDNVVLALFLIGTRKLVRITKAGV